MRWATASCGGLLCPPYTSSILVIRLFLVENPLHRLKMPDVRLLVAVSGRGLELLDRVVDHVLRQDVELAPRLHREDLLLRGALGVIEQVECFRNGRSDGRDAVA